MYLAPKTMSGATTVGELRDEFARRPGMRTALLTDGDQFLGAVERGDLEKAGDAHAPAAEFAQRRPESIGPDDPASEALARLDASDDGHRLVVLDEGGSVLAGLVCLNSARTHFCLDR
jgi:CBS domain-containing protein